MNTLDSINVYGFIAIVIVVAVYDIWLWRTYGVDATITRRIKKLSVQYPAIPLIFAFSIGLITGHLFW